MPTILSRLRGLVAPSTPDQPLRLADAGGVTPGTGGSGGQTILIARNMRDVRRQSSRPPGQPYIPPPTTKGDLFGFASSPSRVAAGIDGQVLTSNSSNSNGLAWATPATGLIGAIPGTIPDLVYWWESDDILASAGSILMRLRERTPWISGVIASNPNATFIGGQLSSVAINGLPTLKTGLTSSTGAYNLTNPVAFPNGCTIFCVVNPGSSGTTEQAVFGGASGSLACALNTGSGVNKFTLIKSQLAVIGSSTASWTAGTPFQANATYNPTTGAFAFRQARTSAGSGTGATAAGTTVLTSFLFADGGLSVSNPISCSFGAAYAYNRILSGPEIVANENYIFSKWGV